MENITHSVQNWLHEHGPSTIQIDGFVNKMTDWFYKREVQKQDALVLSGAAAVSILLVYLATVRHLRYKNINAIRKKYPNPQDVLDDLDIAREINSMVLKKEFPFMSREGAEFALFKTFSIPSMSKLLVATGEFRKDSTRRAEDTELLLMEVIEPDSRIERQLTKDANTPKEDLEVQWKRQDLAITRINQLHGKYKIKNDDYLYTLSLIIFEPVTWINRYEWRKLDIREINAMYRVWYDIGKRMNIKDIPETPEKMLAFKKKYAEDRICYAPTNWKCAEPAYRHLLSNIPVFLRERVYNLGLYLLRSILDTADAEAFCLPQESKVMTAVFRSALSLRAFFIRNFMLPRTQVINRTPFYPCENGKYVPEFFYYKPHLYAEGYSIEELGPEKYSPSVLKCPVMH